MESAHKAILEGQFSTPELEYLQNNVWTFTEKVDGTNIRVMSKTGIVTFGGKTDNASIPAPLIARLNEQFLPISNSLQGLGEDVCLYGEGYGAKIQKGGVNYGPTQEFILFDIRIGKWWLQRKDVEEIAISLTINVVPMIGEGTLHDAIAIVKNGLVSRWGNFEAEGIVARPKNELCDRAGRRIITKIKGRDFKVNELRKAGI